jgi:hypothetical protein
MKWTKAKSFDINQDCQSQSYMRQAAFASTCIKTCLNPHKVSQFSKVLTPLIQFFTVFWWNKMREKVAFGKLSEMPKPNKQSCRWMYTSSPIFHIPLQGHQVESRTFVPLDPLVLCMLHGRSLPCCHPPILLHWYLCVLHNEVKL